MGRGFTAKFCFSWSLCRIILGPHHSGHLLFLSYVSRIGFTATAPFCFIVAMKFAPNECRFTFSHGERLEFRAFPSLLTWDIDFEVCTSPLSLKGWIMNPLQVITRRKMATPTHSQQDTPWVSRMGKGITHINCTGLSLHWSLRRAHSSPPNVRQWHCWKKNRMLKLESCKCLCSI